MRILTVLLILGTLQGCGSLGNVFPDRKKEYKYSEQIAPLEIPPDLTAFSIAKSPIPSGDRIGVGISDGIAAMQGIGQAPGIGTGIPDIKQAVTKAPVERTDEGVYITVNDEFSIAWRMVGRALSRLEIEVEDLNRTDGVYYVIFEHKSEEDGGFLSVFFTDPGWTEELHLRVSVRKQADKTEVWILDEDGETLSDGTGVDLLQMIREKIDQQLAER